MARFYTDNFARVKCLDCGERTEFIPGREVTEMNCKCKKEEADAKPKRGRATKAIHKSEE